jgi:hypothetical protein
MFLHRNTQRKEFENRIVPEAQTAGMERSQIPPPLFPKYCFPNCRIPDFALSAGTEQQR